MAKAKGKKGGGEDPHAPFDKVTLTGTDGKEHDWLRESVVAEAMEMP